MRTRFHKILSLTFWAVSLCCLVGAQTDRTNSAWREEPRTVEVSLQSTFRPLKVSAGVVRFSGRLELVFSTQEKPDVLCFVVGQPVTLRGEFSLRGKIGPFILIGGRPVYVLARGAYSWGPSYERMEGKLVILTGTLHFYKAPPAPAGRVVEARLPDHYYMEAESAQVELVK